MINNATVSPLYHFTDTARLPWILDSGELRPGLNHVGGYPDPDFVWTTSNPHDEASASPMRGEPYRSGKIRHIRFTLPESAFFPWSEVPSRFPAWTTDQVERLERTGRSNPSNWWCRPEPLPLDQVLTIDWRSWSSGRWTSLPPYQLITTSRPWLGIQIDGRCFLSRQGRGPQGQQAYGVEVIDMPVMAAE